MPKLSVIVPFDVTEPHLERCLSSLGAQDIGDTELILAPVRAAPAAIGDGAGDPEAAAEDGQEVLDEPAAENRSDGGEDANDADTPEPSTAEEAWSEGDEHEDPVLNRPRALDIAGEWLRGDSHSNAWLVEDVAETTAAARFSGAAKASGRYLAFVPADDALPSYALRYLTDALDRSTSDLATGTTYRLNAHGVGTSAVKGGGFVRERHGVRATARPELLGDRFWGNKVWRRDLWDAVAEFHTHLPDADDDLAIVAAYLHAGAVDTLPAPVSLRRARPARRRLSQRQDLEERMESLAALDRRLDGDARHAWRTTLLRRDLWRILLGLDDADDDTRARFLDLAAPMIESADPRLLTQQSALRRLGYHLARRRDTARLLETVTFAQSTEPSRAQVARRGVRYYLRYPFFEDPDAGVPRSVYQAGPELRLRQKTERVEWQDGTLVVSGRLGVTRLPVRRGWQQHVRASLVDLDTGIRRRVLVTMREAAEYRLPDVPDAARTDFGGFEIRLDPSRLVGPNTAGGTARWKIELSVFNRGITRKRWLTNPVPGAPRRPEPHRITDTDRGALWARPEWDEDRELLIGVEPVQARLTSYGYAESGGDAAVELRGELSAPMGQGVALRLCRLPGTATLRVPITLDGTRFSADVPVDRLLREALVEGEGKLRQERWSAALVTSDDTEIARIVVPEEVESRRRAIPGSPDQEIAVERTTTGHLRLRAGWAQPAVEEARWDGNSLVLSGRHLGQGDLDLVLKSMERREEYVASSERNGSRFRATFHPAATETLSGPLSMPAGRYAVWGRCLGGPVTGRSVDVRAIVAPSLLTRLPTGVDAAGRHYEFTALNEYSPVLRVGSDLRPKERGRYAQRRLREEEYPRMRAEPVREEITFDSYTGRQCSDSPLQVYDELRRRAGRWTDYPMGWIVGDGQARPPRDASSIRLRGVEYYEALARSRYVVTNSRLPAWFARRDGQTVVQTWHGSMLKRIGFDVENLRGKARDYHEKLAWETAQWDYLVSPSPWATPLLRRAFRFEGEILETGYPRNDVFFAADRERRAADIRAALGLPEDRRVVLYAPTWRDDKYHTRGQHTLDLRLDLERMRSVLGEDHVLLVRRHPRVVDSVPEVGGFVRDVSRYPDIMDLLLVTDVLVSDYSSVMFDFANTGRPMLFFTYDLDSYRDELRGFYFDFEEVAPGPLLRTSDEVIEALAEVDGVASAYQERYTSFTRQFCPLDDGGATARVVDRVFAP
ncbi:CDP-glycerol glycerophosphotransferase family protein [Spiractinospora alimapuensis]|uniref:bifunctional glycosyltransferase/CDP-glycerol:glycerophosphate glycerophosphotransferase n=1 Tax=Spiractinospora alimapuensis TaxID=2820884 RepID=UPI001F3263C7|nr:CDP-glycerol:glycerophosphate glycerophosphotransferase [Spiractinospora alimapuensis]QVQ53589.1 CDP-glycerol glycerophosphotransferase family protein [Spiractinospora alimapuensis]